MREEKKKSLNVLFVCYGNICRSPMAEAIAKKALGAGVRIESAGIVPVADNPTQEAIKVIKDLVDIDISKHCPRNIADVKVGQFDYVIALDSYIFRQIQERYTIPSPRFILWDIEDPYSQGIDVYRKTAARIQERLNEMIKKLD